MTGDSWLYVLGAASLGFSAGIFCALSCRREPPLSLSERMWSRIEPRLAALDALKDVARRN